MKMRFVACIMAAMLAVSGSVGVSAQEISGYDKTMAFSSLGETESLEMPAMKSCTLYGQQIVVAWNTVEKAEGYNIYRKVDSGNWEYFDFVSDGKTGQYCDKEVEDGRTYHYVVEAYAQKGFVTSGYDVKQAVTTQVNYLTAPVLLDAFIDNDRNVTIHWTASKGADGYWVYQKTVNGKWQPIDCVKGTNYTVNGVPDQDTYRFTVRAYRQTDDGAVYFSPYDRDGIPASPYKPAVPSVASNAVNTIKVSWKPVTGADGYYVYRRKAGTSSWGSPLANVRNTSPLTYTDEKAVTAQLYEYAVQAYSGANKSDYAVSKQAAAYRPAPVTMKSAAKSGKYLKVSWSRVTGAAGYRIYRKTVSSGWGKLTDVSASKTSYVDKKAKKNIRYYYKVKAFTKGNGTTYFSTDPKKSVYANNGALPRLSSTQSVYIGGTTQLKVKDNKKKVTWKSMDTSYATVSSKGVVRGKKEGSVKVCAQIDGVKYYCKVKVKRAMTTTAPSTMHIRSRKAIPVTFKLSGKLNFKLSKANIVSVKFGSWKKDKIHLYVTPLRKGTVTLTITNTKNNEKLRFTIYSKK